jgi:hypothetical protein
MKIGRGTEVFATLSITNPTWPDLGSNPGSPRWEAGN